MNIFIPPKTYFSPPFKGDVQQNLHNDIVDQPQMVKETKSLHMINHKHKTRVILGAMKCKYQTPNTTKNAL